ncbi:MAG: indolepyruvate ferredoxin oxidoreductase [Osedax symbiont Rs2]|nr:MAG: indolepyruvate ferredoxin oxidoreductase [Osedax symbiont Rs2]
MKNTSVSLTDRYQIEHGRVLMSGIQALVRLPLDLMRRDRLQQLNTGTFISGYRGSPLGGYDLELGRQQQLLQQYNIKFQPGVNEELGATAVWGSQQVNLFDGATVDGVCGIWYGKTPGVDRSTDAFRHANAAGSAKLGGVLVIAGDDHGCKSSSYPGQSEFAFVDMHMPVLNPASVQEVLDFGIYGIELSRYSGCWVAMITLTENMDSSATVDIDSQRVQIVQPTDFVMPHDGVNIRLKDSPLAQEERLWRYKRPAAIAFCRANKLNKVILDNPNARLGIVSTGKAHLDLLQAMDDLGLDNDRAQQLGIRILKVAMTYPLDVTEIRDFARGLDYLLVVEEKRSLMEVQLKEALYNVEIVDPNFPKIIGKLDSQDNPLLPVYGELSPAILADILVRALPDARKLNSVQQHLQTLSSCAARATQYSLSTSRSPFYCSGCPHNTSTKVPQGSRALAGIGCHYLVQNMDRNTDTFTQMGAEGVSWIGQSAFTETNHVFVNLGDGTYFHSGILAIRAAVAGKVNITYKILFNDAVAMTGGQRHDGELRPDMIARQVLAEGISKLVIVMDDVDKYAGKMHFPKDADIYHRDQLDAIQRQLRETEGVTVIIYDQICATALRRQRKRGLVAPASSRVVINAAVCEACGDCSVQSNCTSVEPVDTPLGVKRQINQSSCNIDLSCVKGFCPSFVTLQGAQPKRPSGADLDFIERANTLPAVAEKSLDRPWSILITGVGGTGVVTVGALLAMAAHIEGKAVTVLDQTGLAQKGGAVYSHIRLANNNTQLHAVRIGDANTDMLIACDLVAAGNNLTCLNKLNPAKTMAIVNTDLIPTADFVLGRPIANDRQQIVDVIQRHCAAFSKINATQLTTAALGTAASANIFMLGYAYQQGGIPLQLNSIYQAIEINAVAVADNLQAFNAGRLAAADAVQLKTLLGLQKAPAIAEDLASILEFRVNYLTDYQDDATAQRYQHYILQLASKEHQIDANCEQLSRVVAKVYFKLLAYKDEYEVARLYTNGDFSRQLQASFGGDYKVNFHLAPELFSLFHKGEAAPKKLSYGPWMHLVFKALTKLKFLRNTPFDLFSYTADRRQEQMLAGQYQQLIEQLLENLTADNLAQAVAVAEIAASIRGFGAVKRRSITVAEQRQNTALQAFLDAKKASAVQNFDPLAA